MALLMKMIEIASLSVLSAQLVGEDTEDRLDPALFGNVEASQESRMAARKDRRRQMPPMLLSMGS
jgi:hypothetical protein